MYPLTGAAGLDLETDVLAPLRKSLQDGGPKARAWANVKTSPYSAIVYSARAPNNGYGQCGGRGLLGGPVEAVKIAWAKYKKWEYECPSCGCESEGEKFCNYYGDKSGTCQSCDTIEKNGIKGSRPGYCDDLKPGTVVDCKKYCFGESI